MTSVKISLDNEVRRVLLRGEDGTTLTFHKLINTLYNLFPLLAGKVFALTWQDDEGDIVTCSSDAELDDAILVMQGKGKVLRFTVQTQQGGEAPVKTKLVHAGVTCDECGVKNIVGIRYKCAIRQDYDLCEACEGKRLQPFPMIKIVEPSQAPQVLIYGLPDGTRNDEGGAPFWPRGGRHGGGGPQWGPHHPHHRRGPPGFAPHSAPNFAASHGPCSAPIDGGYHRRGRGGCQWARRWVPADAVPTAEVKIETPVNGEKANSNGTAIPEESNTSQLEEELIVKAILESLEINDSSKPADNDETSKPKVEGSSTASITVEPAVVVTPPAAIATALTPFPIPAAAKLSMRCVKDVTFPDGTIVQPGTIFHKVWQVRNDGSQAWPNGVALVSVGGNAMANPNAPHESIPPLAPNEEITVTVSLAAPSSPGMYTAYYRLQTKEQQFFGNRLWATVVVSDQDPDWHVVAQKPESPSPSPVPVAPAPIAAPATVTVTTDDAVSTPAPVARPVNPVSAAAPVPAQVPVEVDLRWVPLSAPETSNAPIAPNRAATLLWRRELEILREMGFNDQETVIPLLQTHLGSPLSLSGDKNARPNAEGMQQVVAALLNLMN